MQPTCTSACMQNIPQRSRDDDDQSNMVAPSRLCFKVPSPAAVCTLLPFYVREHTSTYVKTVKLSFTVLYSRIKRAPCCRNKAFVEKSKVLVVLDEDAFSNIDEFHDGSENKNEDDVSDESTDVAEEDWAGLD